MIRGRAVDGWWGTVLDCPDASALARFYADLLGWAIEKEEPGWAAMRPPGSVAYLAFQSSPEYEEPVWPPEPGHQQMMLHLDIEVDDLEGAVEDAVALGARLAEHQPQANVRVMLDPAGHPFCLYAGG
ncbi:MAG: VOC family protein [Actinomycetota bacterium]|nr:VOC family protein [Actinomycetota bacterium]